MNLKPCARVAALALLLFPHSLEAKPMIGADLAARVAQLEDRAALKALVDTFSNLADTKDVARQTLLFTEDASVDTWSDGQLVTSLKGRKQIGDVFGGYLAQFDTVYHINGQQTVELQGDRATGISYCLVVLIGPQDGKRVKQTSGVRYADEYVRRGDEWLIAKRVSHFMWRQTEDVPAPAAD